MNRSYVGVEQRSFKSAIIHLLEVNYGLVGSRRVLEMLAEDVLHLATEFYPTGGTVQPGWLVLTGTKASGDKAHPGKSAGDYPLVTLAWPVLLPEDVTAMINLPPGKAGRKQQADLLKQRLRRLIEYGLNHSDGPVLLTTADLGLMVGRTSSQISRLLTELRQQTGQALPTKGYYFDQGVRPSHKAEIIAGYERGWDEAALARHTQHAQSSVGRYLRDYERVKLLLRHGVSPEQISPMIDVRPSVVDAYVKLIHQYHPELISEANLMPTGA
jgi:hypothetical protein